MEGIQRAIEAGDLYGMCKRLENVLESVTIPAHPIIQEIKELALQQGAISALMSGSGPTVFAIFEEEMQAKAAKKVFEEAKISNEIYLTHFFQP